MKNIMFHQTFSEHNLLSMTVVSLNKNMKHIFSVVLYPVPLPTLHFLRIFLQQ